LGNKEPQSRRLWLELGFFSYYRLAFPAFFAGALVALRGAAFAFFTAFIMSTSFPRSVAFD
jgi:hypothetical protein